MTNSNMFKSWVLLAAGLVAAGTGAFAAPSADLEKELQSLELPKNQAPTAGTSEEALYSVQTRYSPLRGRHEITVGALKNFTPDPFISSNEVTLGYRYHFSNRFNVGVAGSMAFNEMSTAGNALMDSNGILPDLAYPRYRAEMMFGFNILYGKFRTGMDSNLYFDLYAAIGPGWSLMDKTGQWGAVGDLGLAFWLGKWGSMRVGVKDHYQNEVRQLSSGFAHNVMAHLELGVFLGGGE